MEAGEDEGTEIGMNLDSSRAISSVSFDVSCREMANELDPDVKEAVSGTKHVVIITPNSRGPTHELDYRTIRV